MNSKWRTILAWIGATAGILLSIGSLILLLREYRVAPITLNDLYQDVTYIFIGVVNVLVGGLLAVRRGDNVIS